MTATTRVRRPPKYVLFAASAVMIFLGAAVAYRGLVLGYFEITTGPKGGPSTTVWADQGKDAARIGAGGIALAASGVVTLVNAGLKGWTTWGWRFRVGLALALLTLAMILFLPPWKIRLPGTIASVYAFLLPTLGGVLCRSVRALAIGMASGFGLSIAAGGSLAHIAGGGIPGGVIAFVLLGSHLAFLINPAFRRQMSGEMS